MASEIKIGDKVEYSSSFLRNIGVYTGDMPAAQGIVKDIVLLGKSTKLAVIDWGLGMDDPDLPNKVNIKNIHKVGEFDRFDSINKDDNLIEKAIDELVGEGVVEDVKLNNALNLAKAHDSLEAANEYLGGYGIEYVELGGRELAYVNLGDTYVLTVCKEDDEYFISSWGDWYEQSEQEYEEETSTIRCSYCGEFTDMDKDDWSDVVCTSCGHHVDGSD